MKEIARSVQDPYFLQAELEAWLTLKSEEHSQRPAPTVQMALRHTFLSSSYANRIARRKRHAFWLRKNDVEQSL